MLNLNWLIVATFGVSIATAATITSIIIKAGTTGQNISYNSKQ
jgi:hypothetical protein